MEITKEALLREAQAKYDNDRGPFQQEAFDAMVLLDAIKLGETYRTQCRVAQGQLIAQAAREKLYEKHPRKFATLREYVRTTGLSESVVSNLVAVGKLVEFCDRHHIKIDQYLDGKQWPKLREALPTLRRKMKAQDPKGVRAILREIKKLPTRDAVRAKYRRTRPKLGRGITVQLASGQLVVVAVLNDGWGEEEFAGRVGHVLDLDIARNGLAAEGANILLAALQALLNGG